MSNLLKQPFVVNGTDDKIMINSNARMEERMRELIRIYGLDQTSEEDTNFSEGIVAEEVTPPEPKIDPDVEAKRILDEARAECDRMMNEAYAKAKQIEADAAVQAEQLCETHKNMGYQDGLVKAAQEYEEKTGVLEEEYRQKNQQLDTEYQNRLQTMETDLVDAIIQVFNKVFHIQFDGKKDILLHLVSSTLMNIDAGKNFRIRVSEENRAFVEEHIDAIKAKVGNDVTIEVALDMKLDNNSCTIESDYGVYDCGIDTELDGLLRDIRSLCM